MEEEDVFCLVLNVSKLVEPSINVHMIDDNIELLISPTGLFMDREVSTLIDFSYIER